MWDGINRRKFPRANYPCKITLKRKDSGDSFSTHTENIGIGGICVMLAKDLGIFAPVEVILDLLDSERAINCEGTIVWVVPEKETSGTIYDTGIEFTNLKREDSERIYAIVEKALNAV